ncbi:small RNA-binding protein 11, chloroplastic-like [Papaver somniferum]|uniref:small RNA-binding protein 11, chloroplastic-like n=1 Tax=Papaver somniferum TaxID=3469 RepID=UPI000E6FC62C|nr:small RNA-binding protein 11, chloroplastic-like [Papaver somniferum]
MAAFQGISRIIGQHTGFNPSFQYLLPCQLICSRGIFSKVIVRGLPYSTTDEVLSETFSLFGQVVEAAIVKDKVTDRSRGFGFVTFESIEEGMDAVSGMNGKELNGRIISVDIAKPERTSMRHEMPIASGPPGSSTDDKPKKSTPKTKSKSKKVESKAALSEVS